MDVGDRGSGAPGSEGRSSVPRTFIRLNDLSAIGTGGAEPSASGGESLPYPTLAPVVFFYLKQTTRPRSWCLKMLSKNHPNQLHNVENEHWLCHK
uniref:Voltage-dependent T-type calcium channel subunit alpha-1G n=1 Tax=Monopterus albus TaxID=43700 RepID=A0A3Q3IE94_MONAL